MGILEAVLALIGLAMLILIAVGVLVGRPPTEPPQEDIANPYRQGLHAAVRMQTVAQDLEQQLYAEAMRQAEADADLPSGRAVQSGERP